MDGISSKAAGSLENKKKFNGIEYNNDFDINTYDAFYRNLDPQIERFLQIDPKSIDEISPYSAMMNNPILMTDPLGDTTSYYDTRGKVLYTTNAKGYNNAFIVGNDYLDAAKAMFDKLGELDLDQQKALDGAIIGLNNLVGFGDAYDLQSINKFYDENSNLSVEKVGGAEANDQKMLNLTINGKPTSPSFFRGIKGAEASFDMMQKNGVWTVDEGSISSRHDLSESNTGNNANKPSGHLHSEYKGLEGKNVSFTYSDGSKYNNTFFRQSAPSGYNGFRNTDMGHARDEGKLGNSTRRNVLVTYNTIYLYHGDGIGIKINR